MWFPRRRSIGYLGRVLRVLVFAGLVATGAAVATPARAAGTMCPTGGTPPPGAVIHGGLEVDGFQCNLTGVTVYGRITVDGSVATGAGEFPIGYRSIDGSTVHG